MSLSINTDTLLLSGNHLSLNGIFRIINSNIVFLDERMLTASIYDTKGDLIQIALGEGEAPHEIDHFYYHTLSNSGEHIFLGDDYMLAHYNKYWIKYRSKIPLQWQARKKTYQSTNLRDINMYDINPENNSYDTRWNPILEGKYLVIPINITARTNPELNRFSRAGEYFKGAYTVGLINLDQGIFEKGFAGYPDVYLKNKYIPSFDYNYRDIKNDTIYVSYMADSLVFAYNKQLELIFTFGNAAKNSVPNYTTTQTLDEYSKLTASLRNKHGYYSHIYVDNDSDLFFRTYVSTDLEKSELQIYKNFKLIAELETPLRFNIIGKIGDTYYADGYLDEKSEHFGIYQLNIK